MKLTKKKKNDLKWVIIKRNFFLHNKVLYVCNCAEYIFFKNCKNNFIKKN